MECRPSTSVKFMPRACVARARKQSATELLQSTKYRRNTFTYIWTFLLTVGASLLTVLLGTQRHFPTGSKQTSSSCKQKGSNVSTTAPKKTTISTKAQLQAGSLHLLAQYIWGCDRSSHLQNGKLARRKNPGKMGKKMESGLRPEMAKKNAAEMENWTPEWDFGHFFHLGDQAIFSISATIFLPIRAWGHFPFSFPFSRDFCVGQVFHSVNGRSDRKSGVTSHGSYLQLWLCPALKLILLSHNTRWNSRLQLLVLTETMNKYSTEVGPFWIHLETISSPTADTPPLEGAFFPSPPFGLLVF